MANWKYECKTFSKVRALIADESRKNICIFIMAALEECCDELTPDDRENWEYYEYFRNLKSEIHDEIECMDEDDYEVCKNTVNNYLTEMYDLCDEADIWLAM